MPYTQLIDKPYIRIHYITQALWFHTKVDITLPFTLYTSWYSVFPPVPSLSLAMNYEILTSDWLALSQCQGFQAYLLRARFYPIWICLSDRLQCTLVPCHIDHIMPEWSYRVIFRFLSYADSRLASSSANWLCFVCWTFHMMWCLHKRSSIA